MTVRRLVAIVIIFVCVTLAWIVLGSSIIARTRFGYDMLDRQVEGLWGASHKQNAPVVTLSAPGQTALPGGLESSEIDVDFHLQHRRKGLLWYATYDVAFDGYYTFQNPL